ARHPHTARRAGRSREFLKFQRRLPMRFKTLPEWLSWQEQLYPDVIDLGLHRVQALLKALDLAQPGFPILTVGGTNGKGSSVSFAEAMLRAAGHQVGA